ncbi:hypothetical protein CANMA_000138 [Candida margitis]|uniref:uncharacterized protein n=1 Tax=Candida margitis TaxID=1775924 RepID=UPI002225DBB1|nr:uncharacterized protein CANMA_000138 [Candida margitis]KAI5970719.1 hypothetical protein CANMA_000138 [Candida margitis]
MDFESREDRDGVRLSWSSVPKSKLQHQRNVIPMGALYTPLNDKSEVTVLDKSNLISCRSCRSILNPYVVVNNGTWSCQFCSVPNQLPAVFAEDGTPYLQPALEGQFTTVEYETGRKSSLPPVFFYVVDTGFEGDDVEAEFAKLKESLVLSLSLLPENALVGFVSFGKHVKVHDLTSNDDLSYTFNGNKTYNLEQVQQTLGLSGSGLSSAGLLHAQAADFEHLIGPTARRFLQPLSLVEYELTNIIENLVPNSFPHSEYSERPARATGSAINVSTLLLKSILGDNHLTGGHMMVFIAGVCTLGPGKIVDTPLKIPMRSHHDILKEQSSLIKAPTTSSKTKTDTSLYKEAKAFYAKIAKVLVSLGLSCDLFIGSYDQVGLFEMDEVCTKTGGVIVMTDSVSTAIFRQSFARFFKKQELNNEWLDMGFNSTLEVKVCQDLKIEGLIGNASSLPFNKTVAANERMVSEREVGEGKTNSWKLCSVDPRSTYAIYFEKMDNLHTNNAATFIQFLFHYQHPNGEMRLRVTTIPVNIILDSENAQLEASFDQEAALVLVAREAVKKLQTDLHKKFVSGTALSKQLDQVLIDFCTRFAVYNIGMMDSFRLSTTYSLFPQFMFHLRRSPFINVFNSSPDETSFVRHVFMHEDLANSLLMIQPTLLSYDINSWGSTTDEDTGEEIINEPEPVLLDSASLGKTKILLLDTFFQILIHHGSQIAQWRKAGYHEQEEYAYFKDFLGAPKREAMSLLVDRFPLPRFIDCDEGGSQARFLMAKLNPSTSYATNVNHFYGFGDRSDVFTDDVSLQSFMDHVQRVVTSRK